MKAYLVDAKARKIIPIDYEYSTMRQHLPGGICVAQVFETGDVLYVDDEALLRPAEMAFRVKGRPDGQPMMSNGILTGGDYGDDTLPPVLTIAQLQDEIEWLDLDDALIWFRDRAAEPAMTVKRGSEPVKVIAYWRELLRNLGIRYQPPLGWYHGNASRLPHEGECHVGRW